MGTFSDDGTVVCTGVSTNAWVFTTIKSPWDNTHPVSGNRFFSFHMEGTTMHLYTRGVDRVDLPVFNVLDVKDNPAFQGADILWTRMQLKIAQFVNNNGGIALIPDAVIYRPNWTKIADYINGKQSLSSLGCN